MIDFTSAPVVDNHCHPMDPGKAEMEAWSLADEFYHGWYNVPRESTTNPKRWGATERLAEHIPSLGIVQTMIVQLARVLDCEPTLEAVAEARNRIAATDFAGYAKLLYDDAGIRTTVVDSGLADDDPAMKLFPGQVIRLFQMDPEVDRLLEERDSFKELLSDFLETLHSAIGENGCVGVKSHLAERVGFGVQPVTESEAERSFSGARSGNRDDFRTVYTAVLAATLIHCRELDAPVHFHSGFTGSIWDGLITNADPFRLVPFISQHEFLNTEVVLLHGGYPWIQNAAAVAHALPHVWVDMGWTTPWISMRIVDCYRDVMGMAPISKLMVGSGGHGTPEIAWLAGRTAKIALGEALGDAVRLRLMTREAAETSGRMVLYDNAARMYDLQEA